MSMGTSGSAPSRRLIFLHQSTGADILRAGNVRQLLTLRAPSLQLWDYGFNPPSLTMRLRGLVRRPALMPEHYYGLGDAEGRRHGVVYHVANTDPDGLATMFNQPVTNPPTNVISHLLQFEAIAFKSCFTIFPITSDEQLARYERGYRRVRDALDRHSNKLFLPLTPPPLRASLCTPEQAARARSLARWLMSDEFRGDRAYVVPFDLFDALAVPEGQPQANTLRPEFCVADPHDSHPNAQANTAVASAWVAFLADVAVPADQPATKR
jgi:hypothetical protein